MEHTHRFDPLSGWCADCNYRQDGRLISRDGDVWRPGPEYSNADLQRLLETNR